MSEEEEQIEGTAPYNDEADDELPNSNENEEEQEQEQGDEQPGHTEKDGTSEGEEDNDNREDPTLSEAEAGIIEKIVLENFMCHSHLEIYFGPKVNFIVGLNGSGKSAVLVALTVCLGAKATFTNRANSLSKLIKTGKNRAVITVKLRNRGPEAYRPAEFGKSIVVERVLNRDGSSGYKLKDHSSKKTISTKRAELNLILEQFNIQIDNPCSILMQDTSRQFLSDAKPQTKYKLFLVATQLEQMRKDFTFVTEQVLIMNGTLDRKRQLLPDMKSKVEEYRREYNDMHQIKKLEEKVREMKNMLSWAYVVEKEKERDKVKEDLTRHEVDKAKVIEKQHAAQGDLDKLNAALEQKTSEAAEKTSEIEKIGTEISELEKQHREVKAKANKVVNIVRDMQKRIIHLNNRKTRVLKSIEEERQKKFFRVHKKKTKKKKDKLLRKITKKNNFKLKLINNQKLSKATNKKHLN